MNILRSTVLALAMAACFGASTAYSSEEDDVRDEAEAYAVASYAALYNLSAAKLSDQLDRNIIYFGKPSAYVGYLESLRESNLAGRIRDDKGVLTTEVIDVETTPFEDTFLVRLSVRQTLESESYEITTCFDVAATISENKARNLGSSPFTNIGQPVALGSRSCGE